MRKFLNINPVLFCLISLFSCESRIEVPLETANPKLVIDAIIKWQKGTLGNNQQIKLTTTTNFYTNIIPVVSGASVSISNSANVIFNFIETPGTGEYVCSNFVPIINETYTLTIINAGQKYVATDQLLAGPTINRINQLSVPTFGGKEQIQVKSFYQDNGLEENFYLTGVKNSVLIKPEYGVQTDEFFQGNEMFDFYTYNDMVPGINLKFSIQGVNKRYYNYMAKLLSIAGGAGGNPFSTAPAILRGNIINASNNQNFPLGYFALGEIDTKNYVVQ